MKESSPKCGRNGSVAPAQSVIQRGRQYRERGNAVKSNRNSEPKKSHEIPFRAMKGRETSVYRGLWRSGVEDSLASERCGADAGFAMHLRSLESERRGMD